MLNKTIFKTRKIDRTIFLLSFGVHVFLLGITIFTYFEEKDWRVFIAMGSISALLLFITISSFYKLKIIIENHFLTIKFFFVFYKVDIKNITKIRKGETMWSGFHKYGTTTKGLIIFAKYKNDLYITPENEELFYQKILEINPDVVIEKV